MNMISSQAPLYAILVSSAAGFLILASPAQDRRKREFWTFAAAFAKFVIVLSFYSQVTSGKVLTTRLFEILPGMTCTLRVDTLGFYFALLASGLWIITSLYSVGYMHALREHEQRRYFASFAFSLSATLGIAFAGDLLTFFLFYEMLTLATYPLVAHKESREAILGGRKYLVYSLSAGVLMLIAIGWIYVRTGTLDFSAGGFLFSHFSSKELVVLFLLFIYGCGVKAALFPMHAWLPTAMVAPTPVSALLHAVAVVKAGAFALLRVTGFVFGPGLLRESGIWMILAGIAAFTILFSSCIALAQDNLKRRLAYSTISQLSYIALGAALAAPSAYFGAVLHLANHALMKITLFFCAGVIYAVSHKENISEMKGLGRKMPWTFTAFAIGAIGLSGFPPFNGFISKWFLCKGALEVKEWLFCAVFLISALLNAAYLLPVVIQGFSRPDKETAEHKDISERNFSLVAPPIITALAVILFGSVPYLYLTQMSLADLVRQSVFGG